MGFRKSYKMWKNLKTAWKNWPSGCTFGNLLGTVVPGYPLGFSRENIDRKEVMKDMYFIDIAYISLCYILREKDVRHPNLPPSDV